MHTPHDLPDEVIEHAKTLEPLAAEVLARGIVAPPPKEPTPRPWVAGPIHPHDACNGTMIFDRAKPAEYWVIRARFMGEHGLMTTKFVAQVLRTAGMSDEELEGNARLIEVAVNTHDDLLAALEAYLMAGHKEARKQASILAKAAISKATPPPTAKG